MMQKLSMETLNRLSPAEVIAAEKNPVVIVLENIRSAYNVGSFFRTADAFLAEAIYITGFTAVPPHKEIKKTALGAEQTVQWKQFTGTPEAIESLRNNRYTIYAVEQATGSLALDELVISGQNKYAFVFGNEVSGVDQNTISICDGCVEIPQWGSKHSLNVATAGGVVLWEAVRQFKKLLGNAK